MKTLDEVITALEEKPVPMAYTAKVAVQEEDVVDALYYLKEYKKDKTMWDEIIKSYPVTNALMEKYHEYVDANAGRNHNRYLGSSTHR